MKKIIFMAAVIVGLGMSAYQAAYAENVGDVIGNIYSTDIAAYVDDIPIKSYNIGGRTVIQIEDLRDYGFCVNWDEGSRILNADIGERPKVQPNVTIEKQKPGNVVGDIYYTDIRVCINGIDCLQTYNIGGITCAAIEDLGSTDTTKNGFLKYSGYAMRYIYNNDDRTIKLYTLRNGDNIKTPYGTAKIKGIYSNYSRNVYTYTDDKSDNPKEHTIYSVWNMYNNEKWEQYINIADLPVESGITADIKNGVYTISSLSDKTVGYRRFGASNGTNHNDCVVLVLSLPVNIDGKIIDDDSANCIVQYNLSEGNYYEIFISETFLKKYLNRDLVEE